MKYKVRRPYVDVDGHLNNPGEIVEFDGDELMLDGLLTHDFVGLYECHKDLVKSLNRFLCASYNTVEEKVAQIKETADKLRENE